MNIPNLEVSREDGQLIIGRWKEIAMTISMEYGIFVDVLVTRGDNLVPKQLQFEVMGHKFESLIDLRKALELKAFL